LQHLPHDRGVVYNEHLYFLHKKFSSIVVCLLTRMDSGTSPAEFQIHCTRPYFKIKVAVTLPPKVRGGNTETSLPDQLLCCPHISTRDISAGSRRMAVHVLAVSDAAYRLIIVHNASARLLAKHITATKYLAHIVTGMSALLAHLLHQREHCLIAVPTVQRRRCRARTASTREQEVTHSANLQTGMPEGNGDTGTEQGADSRISISEIPFSWL
jgi:hypothetical protein